MSNKFVLVPYEQVYREVEEKLSKDRSVGDKLSQEDILQAFSKAGKNRAQQILTHIVKTNCLEWTKRGELVIGGELIPNSHITDCLKYLIYPYKNIEVVGHKQFLEALVSSNIPKTLLGQKGAGHPPPPGKPLKEKERRSLNWKWHL